MTKTLFASLALTLAATATFAQTEAAVDTSIFPAAKAGMTQHIFQPAAVEDEQNYLIEVVAGQTLAKDCNTLMFGADFEEEDLEGWGYTYYEIEDVSEVASTMMGCPDAAKVDTFVAANMGHDALIRYNSRMPIVVYAPSNLTVGYRIWTTDGALLGVNE